jgi:hypothetical protein
MKLVKRKGETWQYLLEQIEAKFLIDLMKHFPITDDFTVKISKTDTDPKSIEREMLLNESLAEHRKELKRQAKILVSVEKLKARKIGFLLTLSAEEREILLQILNDIRIGCWRALGEPDSWELLISSPLPHETEYRRLMDISGFFEHLLVG